MSTVISLGCRLNIAESESIAAMLDSQPENDLIVVNSCAVTGEAVRNSRRAVRRAKRDNPDARVVVTGCAAQIDPRSFAAMPEVSAVIGNREKMLAEQWLLDFKRTEVRVSDIMAVQSTSPQFASAFAEHARAFVEVQTGCDHRCTFCVIPYGRGNSRSVPAGAVIDRIATLVDAGHREVVLTGVDLTSYGHDLPGMPTLGSLVERILRHVPTLPRLRLSSLDSIEIDAQLFALITQHERMMPHVHLSLQAGDDMILKRMKRRHSRADAIALVERLKSARPEIAIGADIIVGFPTETEEMFAGSLALVAECDIVFGHIFRFSPREGTPAARMPQLDRATIKRRAARLRAHCDQRQTDWLGSMIGSRHSLLVENDGRTGHLGNFAKAGLADDDVRESGAIVTVEVQAIDADQTLLVVPA